MRRRWRGGLRSVRATPSPSSTRTTGSASSTWAPTRRERPACSTPEAIDHLVEQIHAKSANQSRQATGAAASNLDLYQVNCTFYDALGRNDDDYLIARALQFFAPGIPQVYYVGLLAGTNDMDLLARSEVGRDINRHYYTSAEIDAALATPVVQRQIALIRFRNTHPAFGGDVQIDTPADDRIDITWTAGTDARRTARRPDGAHRLDHRDERDGQRDVPGAC